VVDIAAHNGALLPFITIYIYICRSTLTHILRTLVDTPLYRIKKKNNDNIYYALVYCIYARYRNVASISRRCHALKTICPVY